MAAIHGLARPSKAVGGPVGPVVGDVTVHQTVLQLLESFYHK